MGKVLRKLCAGCRVTTQANRHFFCQQDLLETVFEDGVLVKEYTFAQVRENAEIPLVKEAKTNCSSE